MKILALFIFIAQLLSTSAIADPVKLDVSVPKNSKGILTLVLYSSPDDFLGENGTLYTFELPPSKTQFEIDLGDLSPATYALVAFIDENGNGQMDKKLLGIPKEPIGFSEAKMQLFGPPSFEKASFKVPTKSSIELVIERH
ncbi:MAG: DUF2141 domain-containing protein [Bacteroidetes bacterium]|jgi:uncharacterized protein (DUF2141 family)|nr:DUF2141 domain-containing protein [Bacteroidota bacterium]